MIAEMCGKIMFKIVRNSQTVFHTVCTIVHSHWQQMRVPIALYSHQKWHCRFFFFVLFLILCHYSRHVVCFQCCFHCNFLTTNDAEHLFIWKLKPEVTWILAYYCVSCQIEFMKGLTNNTLNLIWIRRFYWHIIDKVI